METNFGKMGLRELQMASDLLQAYINQIQSPMVSEAISRDIFGDRYDEKKVKKLDDVLGGAMGILGAEGWSNQERHLRDSNEQILKDGWYSENFSIQFNPNSGLVWLEGEDSEMLILDESEQLTLKDGTKQGTLKFYHYDYDGGTEGTYEEIKEEWYGKELSDDQVEWIQNLPEYSYDINKPIFIEDEENNIYNKMAYQFDYLDQENFSEEKDEDIDTDFLEGLNKNGPKGPKSFK